MCHTSCTAAARRRADGRVACSPSSVLRKTSSSVELLRSNLPQEDPPLKKFLRSEEGIAVTEYGLLIALVAIALIAVVTVFGNNISSWFSKKTGQITTV